MYFNRQLNLPQIQRILQEFEKQSEVMDMKEEVMNDAMDDAMDDEADEEETYVLLIVLMSNIQDIYFFISVNCSIK